MGERRHAAASGRQHHRRARQERRSHEMEAGAEHAVPRPEVHEPRRLPERRCEPRGGVDDAARLLGRPRREDHQPGRVTGERTPRVATGQAVETRRAAQRPRGRPPRRRERRRIRQRDAPSRGDRPEDGRPGDRRHAPVHDDRDDARDPAPRYERRRSEPGIQHDDDDPRPQRPEQPGDPVGVLAHGERDRVARGESRPRPGPRVGPHAVRQLAARRVPSPVGAEDRGIVGPVGRHDPVEHGLERRARGVEGRAPGHGRARTSSDPYAGNRTPAAGRRSTTRSAGCRPSAPSRSRSCSRAIGAPRQKCGPAPNHR